MPEKKRVTLYLTADTWDRARAVVAELHGAVSLSQLVDQFVAGMVPMMEDALEQAKAGDRDGLLRVLDAFVAGNLGRSGQQLSALRQELMTDPGEEDTG